VRDLSRAASSWRAELALDGYLRRHAIPGISGIDTRRLTRHLRSRGALRGALSTVTLGGDELVDRARAYDYAGSDLVGEVTTAESYRWGRAELEARCAGGYAAGAEVAPATRELLENHSHLPEMSVAALDFGIKRNSLDLLAAVGCELTVWPATTGAEAIVSGGFDAVFLSNGPGDPERVSYGIATAKSLLGRLPLFGICLGHQIVALSAGATTFKLPFGHRGSNHPVKRMGSERIEITCQNHGFAVDPDSVARTGGRPTHVNLNDHTIEGLAIEGLAFGVQYHPEAGPGPHDSRYLFGQLRHLVARFEPREDGERGRPVTAGLLSTHGTAGDDGPAVN
jgi:carbamoyl-phosphate synthase small subunit